MEISLANKHAHRVPGEIFCFTTLFLDQGVIPKYDLSHDPLYAYKATSGQDTLYLHEVMNIKYWP